MKSLHLLRHAKSSWKDPGLNDHDRPLSKRGRQTAKMMAAYLRRAKIAPDLVVCSTAMRAQQTLGPIAKAKKPPKVVLEREIYGGTQRALWEQLWNLPESAKCVLLIGHNPALHDLALELGDADLNKLLPSAGGKFPTGAMASFRFDGAWKALGLCCKLWLADNGRLRLVPWRGVAAMNKIKNEFGGRHFTADVILWAVRWYLQFPISYRDLERMLADRGVSVDHTTVSRWTQRYAPEIEKRLRPHLQMTNGSWRVDETYIKVKGRWTYLYHAVDSRGQTIDFLLSAKRDASAALRFFRKALKLPHTVTPRTITVDKNPAYPSASKSMKKAGELSRFARLRQVKYLNNIVEQDHRRIKRLVRPGLGFKSMSTARRIIAGYEIFAMIRKGQVARTPANDMVFRP
jgi:IS6 family transposase